MSTVTTLAANDALPRRKRLPTKGIVGGAMFLAIVLVSLLAFAVAPHDPLKQDLLKILKPPSPAFWLGTDNLGRDVLSRLLFGGQHLLAVMFVSTLATSLVGLALGVLAGLGGGRLDMLLGRLADVQLSLPTMLLVLTVLTFTGNSLPMLVLILIVSSWVLTFRVTRSRVISILAQPYIEAARLCGAAGWQLFRRHLLPGVLPVFLVSLTLNASAIVALASNVGFLGLGVQPPTPDWGHMVSSGQARISISPWLSLLPGAALVTLLFSLQLIGDALADYLDANVDDVSGGDAR